MNYETKIKCLTWRLGKNSFINVVNKFRKRLSVKHVRDPHGIWKGNWIVGYLKGGEGRVNTSMVHTNQWRIFYERAPKTPNIFSQRLSLKSYFNHSPNSCECDQSVFKSYLAYIVHFMLIKMNKYAWLND